MKKNSRIFIAGQNNIVTAALTERLKKAGFANALTMPKLDLLKQSSVRAFFDRKKPEYCFLPSLKEGGIQANIDYPADLMYENLVIQANIIDSARRAKVKRLLFFASSCVYPKDCPQPMKEEHILTGRPEPTSEPYAVSKIAGIKMCQAYSAQYRSKFSSVIPATIYGPGDNFNPETSHVIPSLIVKFHKAKALKKSEVSIWGTGKPRREFIYIDDLIDAILMVMGADNLPDLINLGTGADISIYELANIIKDIVAFRGNIKFDDSKPDGAARKMLDVSRLYALGFKPATELKSGIENTYKWYLKNV